MKLPLLIVLGLLLGYSAYADGDSWSDILASKEGRVAFYWYPNNITVSDSKDIIDGIEHDLAFAFVDYLEEKYKVKLQVEWNETQSFDEVMEIVQNATGGVFGASSISITEERRKIMNFTPPYLSDVAVLVSHANIPIAHTPYEFRSIFKDRLAISIPNTTLNSALLKLKADEGLTFDLKHVQNSGQIIEQIERMEDGFGYIDLPNFLISINKNSRVRRQFFHPIKLEGLAMIYPLNSDWKEPVQDYFSSSQFKADKAEIILRYLGKDVTDIIDRIAKSADFGPLEEIVISNREKELQYEELLAAAERDKEKSKANNILILVVIVAVLILLFLYVGYQLKSRNNKILLEQQEVIAQRNAQLQSLNNEKNDLIQVLAHDLRSPLSSISGFSALLKKSDHFSEEDHKMNDYIAQSSEKMEAMITKILDVDAIESGERNMEIETFDVNEVVATVRDSNLSRAEKKEIKIETQLEETAIVKADRFYTAQIIQNLLSNAIKFSRKNTMVSIRTFLNGNNTRIAIKDQGPGFSDEDQKKIFKKYQRLSSQPTAGESSVGLGLSIVKLYTEMMGGKIAYNTEQGSGTEFFIDLNRGT